MDTNWGFKSCGVSSFSEVVCLGSVKRLRSHNICLLALGLAATLLTGTEASAQTVLIDTGAGGNSSIGANSLFGTSGSCSPQPACSAYFQFIAAEFTLAQATTLDSIQVWMGPFGSGGSLDVRIRSVNPAKNGLPGDTQPPYLGPVSIYDKTYTLGNTGSTADWVTFSNYNAILAAGTYWLSLEPVAGSGLNYSMPGGAPNPLLEYAYFDNGNPGYLALNPNPGIGVRILGTNFPGYAFGTATRTILSDPFFDITNGGDGQALSDHWIIDLGGHGWSFAVARLNENGTQDDLNGLSAGAYAVTCWSLYASPCSVAGGRGVAYRTFINTSTVAKTFRINAALEGGFFGTGGARATAGIYAFDTTGFTNTLNGSGVGVAQYLLQRDSLAQLGTADSSISLASLFPGSVLTTAFDTPSFVANQVQTIPLQTGFITINPQETFTLMFDVTAYSANGGSANFADTLAPATNFFTDASDNPVPEIMAVGPPQIPSAAPASLALSPATATSPVGTTYTVTATATDSTGAPVPNATVFFNITSGPSTSQPGPALTDANGQATFSYSSPVAGTDNIQANIGTLQSNVVQNTWTTPGPLDHIVISPSSATIAAGASQLYTAAGYDKFNNSRGDVTGTTTFSITPDGSCTGASCTASVPGPHTVMGTNATFTSQASLTVNAAQTAPVITWAAPAPIPYGTPLSGTQLNATANVAGTFVYTPAAGTVLSAGPHGLSVSFTPTDTTHYTTASAAVNLQVNKATPAITWPTPTPIAAGTPLSATQLNATANVPGAFVYTPGAGTVLSAGSQLLSVVFTPTDTTDYNIASAQVTLVVNPGGKTTPTITWPTPAPITFGTPLSSTQLNATANVPGSFVYAPKAGTILGGGTQTLTAAFTPSNTTLYNTATVTVVLQVNPARPPVLWVPIPIVYGTPLGPLQLDALTLVPGKFTYTPPPGTVLPAGQQKLTAVFTPTNTANFQTISLDATLLVLKAPSAITWAQPASITAGTPLGAAQLNATANIPGTFVYSPPAGTKLSAGTWTLTTTFTPADSADYQTANAQVRITVKSH